MRQEWQKKDQQAESMDEVNQRFLIDEDYNEVEDLEEKLKAFKVEFMEYDVDHSGDIDLWELKLMLEKLGQPKTHLEMKKMIKEVDTTNSGTITYPEFLTMMLGKKSSVLKMILMFEKMHQQPEKPKGPPPKVSINELLARTSAGNNNN